MVIKGKIRILKWEDKQKVSFFCLRKAKGTRMEEKREKKRGRKKRKEKKEKNKGMFFFCMESSVLWMSRVIGVIARVFL